MKRIVAGIVSALVLIVASLHAVSLTKVPQGNNPQREPEPDALFLKNCAICHGKDGRAKTFTGKLNHAQNLTRPKWQASITDEHMFISILKGKGKMPAFGKKLSENEIAALVTYVRMLKK